MTKCNSPTYTAIHQKISNLDQAHYRKQFENETDLIQEMLKGVSSHDLNYSNTELLDRYTKLRSIRLKLGELI